MHKRGLKIFIIIAIVVLAAVGTVFGVQAITHTGLFKIPGKIITEELTELQTDFLHNILYSEEQLVLELDQDVVITGHSSLTRPNADDDLLYEIQLPVTGFYSTQNSVSADELDAIASNSSSISDPSGNDIILLPFSELTSKVKLLAIDDQYFLDDPNSGAKFEYFSLSGENPDDIAKVKELIATQLQDFPTSHDDFLTFAQTGVTALSRGMTAKLNSVKSGTYFSEYIADFLKSFDLTHTSNESSFTASAGTRQICSPLAFEDTLLDIGLDIVELTGNHNQDCGDQAAINTIDFYEENDISIVGGGKTATAAKEPLLINQKNTGITMLAYNLSTGGYTLDNTPGANFYNEEDAVQNIAAAKARGDFVIIDIQFYECAAYDKSTWTSTCIKADSTARDPKYGSESQFFRHLIDLGADMVVGTAAHQTQTYELYNNGVIYYGLGNLFFDQIWWPDTTRSLVLGHYFYNGELLQTRLYGTIYGNDYRTRLMNEEEQTWFINQLNAAR